MFGEADKTRFRKLRQVLKSKPVWFVLSFVALLAFQNHIETSTSNIHFSSLPSPIIQRNASQSPSNAITNADDPADDLDDDAEAWEDLGDKVPCTNSPNFILPDGFNFQLSPPSPCIAGEIHQNLNLLSIRLHEHSPPDTFQPFIGNRAA